MTRTSDVAKSRLVLLRHSIAAIACILAFAPPSFGAGGPIAFPAWSVAPFAVMLLGVALGPTLLVRHWHSQWNVAAFVALVAGPTALWLLNWGPDARQALFHELRHYSSFIALLLALYVIAGGIVLRGDLPATPVVNSGFLAAGALLANAIGTTGASVVLIRPLLRINHDRRHTAHLPIFFLIIVSNLGGLLTPLGDPPLFLGFLNGVSFGWTLGLWPQWLVAVGLSLLIFLIVDYRAWRRESPEARRLEGIHFHRLRVKGRTNVLLILLVMLCVLLESPRVGAAAGRWIGADLTLTWPWCDIFLFSLAGLSLLVTRRERRAENRFTWSPIVDVIIVFAGIFVTMAPAINLLRIHGPALGLNEPWQYFWLTGSFSSMLDNAPTYLVMATLASGGNDLSLLAQNQPAILAAISCGAVFFGALTYVGNGPNFMVKAIVEQSGRPMLSFVRYSAVAVLILFPIFLAITLLFFRGT